MLRRDFRKQLSQSVTQPANHHRLKGEVPDHDKPCDWAARGQAGKFPSTGPQGEETVVEQHGADLRPDVLVKLP
jgi:hypothetical protein